LTLADQQEANYREEIKIVDSTASALKYRKAEEMMINVDAAWFRGAQS
jgi:hypothetical protein